ncbi:LOW QUALITY PROTEIN: beta-galactosidase-1-like protein 2 [Hyaena hyaena]|uniref:LOW QUALITY PROTEIN: beta-galactosidase-1-like protein 2 n=1 Tax=Hyaena hyaena TaxID=95912 RepID=UPI001920BDCC|nr:LOW QUALITY PROTEIN: beta-galactosidase-1-like protein 2 [Hyaena hyaena]
MLAFSLGPVGILSLSSGLLVMAQFGGDLPPRINQVYLTPFHVKNRNVGLKVGGSSFTLDGSPFLIIAGTIHYFRVPREYWRDRLLKLKACGFNTLTTHIPWNFHEPRKGWFYFTANLDFMTFISMASEVGLWVILCPGPYIGSDLDLGSLPSWLLQDPKMKLRTTYKGFTKAVNQYFNELIPKIVPLQYGKGGPIIAVQVENEYGSYHQDKRYMTYIKKAMVTRGIKVLLMTADDAKELKRGHLKHVLSTFHMRNIKKETYDTLLSIQGRTPILMMVYTASSLDGWGTAHNNVDSHPFMKEIRDMFNYSFSLNFYMFHGGTNFGFMGGSASLDNYLPMITSYDYGALLTENGEYTSEYLVFQELFTTSFGVPMPQRPGLIPKAIYKSLVTSYYLSLWDVIPYLKEAISSVKPVCMEKLSVNQGNGQSSGYILYEVMISTGGLLTTKNHVQDRGQVFLDEDYLGVLDHSTNQLIIPTKMGYKDIPTLRILVENQGLLAYGQNINKERKGLIGDIYLNNSPLRRFKIYSLDMKTKFLKRDLPNIWKPVSFKPRGPAFFLGILRMGNYPKDTFIKMEGWTKGVIFINGQNLGRYWNVGPQETLYLPGPWLHPGSNEIIVFEEFRPGREIQFTNLSHLGSSSAQVDQDFRSPMKSKSMSSLLGASFTVPPHCPVSQSKPAKEATAS